METLANQIMNREQESKISTIYFRGKASREQEILTEEIVFETDSADFFSAFSKPDTDVLSRTRVYDEAVAEFMRRNPSGTVVNLCHGRDNRFERLNNTSIRWIDVNLKPELLGEESYFDQHERFVIVKEKVGQFNWLKQIPPTSKTLFVAEDAWKYFNEVETRLLINKICECFDSCELLLETEVAPNQQELREVQNLQQMETWNGKMFLFKEWFYQTILNEKQWLFRCFSMPLVNNLPKIGHFKIG